MSQALVTTIPHAALAVPDEQVSAYVEMLSKYTVLSFETKDPNPLALQLIARLAIAYGLDPLAGELMLYAGRPYLTYKGAVRIAENNPAFDGVECSPASADERAAYRCTEGATLWIARVWRKDRKVPFVCYGCVEPSEYQNVPQEKRAYLPLYKWPNEMAAKRAKHRALKDAFSLPLPEHASEPFEGDDGQWVNTGTGEIIEVVGRELPADGETLLATPEQIKAIHTLLPIARLEQVDYRSYLRAVYDVDSSTALTQGQAASFLEFLGHGERREEYEREFATGRAVHAAGEALSRAASRARTLGWMEAFQERADYLATHPEFVDGRENPIFHGGLGTHPSSEPEAGRVGDATTASGDSEGETPGPEVAGDGAGDSTSQPSTPMEAGSRDPAGVSQGAAAPSSSTPEPHPTKAQLDHYRLKLQDAEAAGLDPAAYEINGDTITLAAFGTAWNRLIDDVAAAQKKVVPA